jgi:transglutaminase-like putative cysteine protease
MRAPPLYLAAAVVFWAWHADVLVLGAAMAMVLEAPLLVHARWSFAPTDFARIGDLCTWAFIILAGYLTFTKGMPIPILEIFRWLPLILLPLVAAQMFSDSGRVPLRAMFVTLRAGRYARIGERGVDLSYTYVVVCALSAGAANLRHDSYYFGLLLLAGWGLWTVRSTRYPWFVWLTMFAFAGAIGFAGQLGLSRLQQIVMDSTQSMFSGSGRIDPYKSTTDIGEIGDLKQSGRIVLRVAAPQGMTTPLLVHTASYNTYMAPSWVALNAVFGTVGAEAGGNDWVLSKAGTGARVARITVSQPVERDKAVLALPDGTLRIEGLPVPAMQRNGLGAVEIESHEDLATYQVVFAAEAASRDAPQPSDLRVPRSEAATLAQIVGRLQLKSMPAKDALDVVSRYFEREFRYSTYLAMAQPQHTPLSDFLLVTHAGHCEYFATATTLLLRAAGIPARYATGFSVQEWSPLEERYIVRERHAHAWTQVWVDGRWADFDTTPPVWFAVEAEDAGRTQKLSDLWAWAMYRFTVWENGQPGARTIIALILVLPLTAILVWRLLIQDPLAIRRAQRKSAAAKRDQPGADSEFYEIEAHLVKAGYVREAGEPLGAWLARIARERADIAIAQLQDLLRLHYRYRFDPQGLSAGERSTLGREARRWLRQHLTLTPGAPVAGK